MMHSQLGGRSRGDNTIDSSSGSLYATCVPGRIGVDLGKSSMGIHS
jgi:hypothetical protein